VLVAASVFCAVPARVSGAGKARAYMIGGIRYVRFADFAQHYGFGPPVLDAKSIRLRSQWSRLTFLRSSRRGWYNGTSMWLVYPTRWSRQGWLVAGKDAEKLLDPLLRPRAAVSGRQCRVVVLDPGHGGRDKGASGRRNVEEKRVVLDVAKRVQRHLRHTGLTVRLTRDKDVYVSLEDRTRRAAHWRADLFVSIHLNSSSSAQPSGVETYVVTPAGAPSTHATSSKGTFWPACPGNGHDGASTVLGCFLQQQLVAHTQQADRGLRHARFAVLRNAVCPAALVECGFVSNRREEELMLQRAYRDTIAQALAAGIRDYANTVAGAKVAPGN